MLYLSTFLLSMLLTVSLVPLLIKAAGRFNAVDLPDARKVHTMPVPRIGGIAIAAGAFASLLFWAQQDDFLQAYLAASAIIIIFGLIDDLRGLDYKIKFSIQLIAALIVVFWGNLRITSLGVLLPESFLLPPWVSIPLTVVLIVGVTNAINLADGLDGLAGGMCLLSFCCIGYLAYLSDNLLIAFLCIALIGSVFGFLRYNTHPASLFMGDEGSQFLGFSLATTSIALTQNEMSLSPMLPVLLFGFPVLDTFSVMFERISQGRSPFAADKNHFHHRLMHLGFSHTEAVLAIYVIQAILVIGAFVLRFHSGWLILGGYCAFAGTVLYGFHAAENRGYALKRHPLLEKIENPLRTLRKGGLLIKISFRTIQAAIPLLLIITCLLPDKIPSFLSWSTAALLTIIIIVWALKRDWLRACLTMALYLFIPATVYFGAVNTKFAVEHGHIAFLYNASFVFTLFPVILTLRYTRRRKGFKATTMDFLIFFIAVLAPFVAGTYGEYRHFGIVAAKTIMFYFSYEVLIGELRGKLNTLTLATACAFIVVLAKGLLG